MLRSRFLREYTQERKKEKDQLNRPPGQVSQGTATAPARATGERPASARRRGEMALAGFLSGRAA